MHEQVVRTDVVGDLVAREPQLERDVVFGIRAHALVEDRLADHVMRSWADGESLATPTAGLAATFSSTPLLRRRRWLVSHSG